MQADRERIFTLMVDADNCGHPHHWRCGNSQILDLEYCLYEGMRYWRKQLLRRLFERRVESRKFFTHVGDWSDSVRPT